MRNFKQSWPLIVLLISCHALFGQNIPLIDSLNRELKKQQTDTGKIRLFLAIAHQYATSDTTSSLLYIEQAKKIAERIDNKKCDADILIMEGALFRGLSNFPKALEKLEKALSIYRQLNIKIKIARCCLWIGSTYIELSQKTKALVYFSEALELFKLLNYNPGISQCYFLMATVYDSQGKYKKSIDFSRKSLQLADKKNKKVIAELYYNLFNAYRAEKEYQKALSLEDSILPVFKEINNLYLLGRAYAGFGILYSDMGNYTKAKASIQQAVYYCSKFKNLENFMLAEICLAQIYSKTNQLDSSIFILKNLLDINKKQLKSIAQEDRIYYELFRAYEQKGDLKSALEYCNKYLSINDSVTQDLNNKKLLEIQTQYDVELKNEQIKLLRKDKQLAKQKAATYGIGLIAILISGLCFSIYKYRKTREKHLRLEAGLKEASYKIDLKNRELTHKAIHLSQQEQILSNIKEQLENVNIENHRGKEAILGVLSDINMQLKQNALEDFEKYFIQVHPGFFNRLKQKYPEITQAEVKVCALLRLNLNSKEIANLTHKSIRSVENTRTSIRKKMGLSKENLFDCISEI